MGRIKYTNEENAKMTRLFIESAREIIAEDGLTSVSIRKVAANAGFNGATIYRYFDNVDELVTMATLSCLESYCRELETFKEEKHSAIDTYILTWNIFCQNALKKPNEYYNLFFSKRRVSLDEIFVKYYTLFPEKIKLASGTLLDMFKVGDIEKRNIFILKPLVKEGYIEEDELQIVNEMTICYFRKVLEEQCNNPEKDIDQQIQKVMHGVKYLISKK